ncbi:phenylalanine--tRNA ligase subunit alpha [Peptostreptococcus faecalis]|uniref:phenylalanine--tRNA ligase subunit alpha n=1 Tax=Peptostreptococcus faecalis TaxID=2045015 RepID=UPI000C7B099F
MIESLKNLGVLSEEKIRLAKTIEELESIRVEFLGKKGELTKILKDMGKLPGDEKPVIGKLGNEIREKINSFLNENREIIKNEIMQKKLDLEKIDVTIPGKEIEIGKKHIISKMIDEVSEIFIGMGFSIMEGPEIETVRNNFDYLNAPKDHPSRDMTDTFYITDDLLLRTQTSPVQIRTMEAAVKANKLPLKILAPGRCFRNDSPDATHSPMFHQIELLVVGKGITFTEFKGTMETFVKKLFGEDTKTKFRPHNFPFTEPSAEIDVSCFKCGGEGCSVCKGEGWIEILGAGMVHPNVLRNCGIDPDEYTGFAAGMGVERLGMLKYGIDDIRLMFENDVRFLDQF